MLVPPSNSTTEGPAQECVRRRGADSRPRAAGSSYSKTPHTPASAASAKRLAQQVSLRERLHKPDHLRVRWRIGRRRTAGFQPPRHLVPHRRRSTRGVRHGIATVERSGHGASVSDVWRGGEGAEDDVDVCKNPVGSVDVVRRTHPIGNRLCPRVLTPTKSHQRSSDQRLPARTINVSVSPQTTVPPQGFGGM